MKLPSYQAARSRNKEIVEREEYQLSETKKDLGLGKTYYIKTYGCQMNEHDTENIKAILEEMSFKEIEDYENADLILLNTCSIRENAHNKAFGMLGRLKHLKEEKPNIVVGLCGCMAQEEGVVNEILEKYKHVNFVFGTHNLHRLPVILEKYMTTNKQEIEVLSKEGNIIEGMPVKRMSSYKAYVNIIYGCDKFCTYCIVPYTRGKQRSRKKEDILKEVEQLVRDGYQEVTLLGQNVNAYGKDLDDNYFMEDLLRDVAKTNIPRVRFMTSHPWDFTDKMIDTIREYPNIMPSVHLPVQSGSSRILKLMGRRYTKEAYLELFDKIKERVPNVTISTDIIVGFPGETEEDFKDTLDLVEHCKYDNAFTFIYSPRENTAAAKLIDNTPLEEKEQRLYRLNEIVNKYFLENNQKLIGTTLKVLVEGINENGKTELFGYTEGNKLINFNGSSDLIGKIIDVKVTNAKTWSLDGEIECPKN
ncbi:MAG: tRNA (N6-isopentenyl adenosine(37)-C2)-methylthiotransferase MiaB [Firmicutes bacterium]|nr:tRNA (N6-isopentenyl adenosine(37)-C2)-methylthiotransferase MiaB [Bacillota bacterium]